MRLSAREKEWNRLMRQERSFLSKCAEHRDSRLNRLLADKVPDKLQGTLDAAFAKAFEAIFDKGTSIIEKTYRKEEIEYQHKVNIYSADLAENKKTLRKFSRETDNSNAKNLLLSGASGIGLGVLGIGLPDIPLFVAELLKSIYEVALHFGYDYESTPEKYFILKLIETALSGGQALADGDAALNCFIDDPILPAGYDQKQQIRDTAATMSTELLYLKFLQGIPIVGAVGGAYNAVYMQKVQKYAKLKYYRRFLTDREADGWQPDDAG